jgi:hypothetical protein
MVESRSFTEMHVTWNRSPSPPNGTPAFLVSKAWLDKYKAYIFYDDVQAHRQPQWSQSHEKDKYPGPIENNCLLNLDRQKYLAGTGKCPEFEPSVCDTYLRRDAREIVDFEVFSEEMYGFVADRYGID